MPRIVRDMTPSDLEGRALDILETIPTRERQQFARFLRIYGLVCGSSARDFAGLAKTVEQALNRAAQAA